MDMIACILMCVYVQLLIDTIGKFLKLTNNIITIIIIIIVAPSLYSLKCMIATCEEFAKKHQITFNPTKSKLLCFNACGAVTPHIKLNSQPVSVVHKDKHLGNYISDSIHDRHILNNICDLYQRSNLLISQFRSCDSETLDRLHKTYCMHMYGCELWNLSCSYINGYKVAWRKIKRRIWNISPRTHNNLVSNVTDNIDTLIETRMVRFIFNSINHSNNTCKNILRVKLLSVNSTFAANYQYLSYKYGLIEADWFTPLGHLLGKVKKKILLLHPHPVLCGILKELCGIRDNTSSCDIANNNDIVALINDICTSIIDVFIISFSFFMCVNIIYVCICLYCVICLILYYRSLLICTNKEFMNNNNNIYSKSSIQTSSID